MLKSQSSSKEQSAKRIIDYLTEKETQKKNELNQKKKSQNQQYQSIHTNNAQNQIDVHYTNIGSNYEQLWKFEEQFEPQLYQDIVSLLQLEEHDIIIDLGGGNGEWSEKIKERNPNCEVVLVEISAKMLQESEKRKNIHRLLMNDEQFLKSGIYFNKMLIKYCIHHFGDIKKFLDDLQELLPEGGRAVVVTLTDEAYSFPYPEIVKKHLENNMDKINQFRDQFYEKNWFSQIIYKNYPVTLEQEEIKKMIKGRFTSTLSLFTDQQLQDGIDNLFQDKLPNEKIDFFYNLSLLLMEKPYNLTTTEDDLNALRDDLQAFGIQEAQLGMKYGELKQKISSFL